MQLEKQLLIKRCMKTVTAGSSEVHNTSLSTMQCGQPSSCFQVHIVAKSDRQWQHLPATNYLNLHTHHPRLVNVLWTGDKSPRRAVHSTAFVHTDLASQMQALHRCVCATLLCGGLRTRKRLA